MNAKTNAKISAKNANAQAFPREIVPLTRGRSLISLEVLSMLKSTISLKTNPNVWPKKPTQKRSNRRTRSNSCIASAPITGEIPVKTALNERASFRYSRIFIPPPENSHAHKNPSIYHDIYRFIMRLS